MYMQLATSKFNDQRPITASSKGGIVGVLLRLLFPEAYLNNYNATLGARDLNKPPLPARHPSIRSVPLE